MIEKFFRLKENGTNIRQEMLAGLSTFAAMAYILAVNPSILSATGMDPASLVSATALAAAFGTLLMAFLTNYPIALAPGMGLNAFFAFTICLGMGIPWQAALSLVFWNGILFLLLSLTGIRSKIADAIPPSLKIGVTCGIGFFIAFLGLKSAGIVVDNPATLVSIGDLSQPGAILSLMGILLTATLVLKRVPGAILWSILAMAFAGIFLPGAEEGSKLTPLPEQFLSVPGLPSETFLALEWWYPFTHFGQVWPIILALLFVDMFDTIGTLVGVSNRAGFLDKEGRLPKMGNALTADAGATIAGAMLGTSTTTSYIESAAGVEEGGKTGLTGVTVAVCFLLALFFTPLITSIPPQATAPALLIVGIFMLQGMRDLDLSNLGLAIPALTTAIAMPLTFSISDGIGLGFILYAVIMPVMGKGREVSPLSYGLAIVFLLHFLS